jgi:hypothetical protein
LQHADERHAGGERKVDDLEEVLLLLDYFHPLLDPRVADHLTDVDIGVVQENVRILSDVLESAEKIVLYVLIGMAAVDEGDIYFGNPRLA